MNRENVIIYHEDQRFAAWVRWLVNITMIAAVLLSVYALRKEFTWHNPSATPELITSVVAGIVVPIAIAIFFNYLKLETEIRSDGLYIRFFPFHIHFKKFTADEIGECYARQYRPIREYGGWGIMYSVTGRGRAYNVSGNKGVQLVFKDGRKLLIGSQKAGRLEEAIRSII